MSHFENCPSKKDKICHLRKRGVACIVAEIRVYVPVLGETTGVLDYGIEGKLDLIPYGLRSQKGRRKK